MYWIARAIAATVRTEIHGFVQVDEIKQGRVFAGWHGRSFIPAIHMRGKGVWALISQSRDGEVQNGIFTRLGFRTIRGSTKRGGMRAAAESIRVLKKNETMAFTPDGPRGPSEVVQGGVITMAKKSGAALIPVGSSASRKWLAPTWDKYLVPKPFSKCVIYYGSPMFVSPDASDEEMEQARIRLQDQIKTAQAHADAHFRR